jgi:putative ABC transport system permease protein
VITNILRNVRYAFRTLGRTPGFTVLAVLTLALGIGANGAVFSAIDTVLLRPMPFPNADRLVLLRQVRDDSVVSGVAPIRVEDWNSLSTTFESIAGFYMSDNTTTTGEFPEKIRTANVGPRFFDVLGITPALGRGFAAEEYRFGGPSAVLLGDGYWRARGADPAVLDNPIPVGSSTINIVGVLPPELRYPEPSIDAWTPVTNAPWTLPRTLSWYTAIGRLRPGVTLDQAEADLENVQAQLAAQFPETDSNLTIHARPLKDIVVGGSRASLWLLFGAVSMLLLIACTNIAALLLARATRRERELAIKAALGAPRGTLAAQVLTEAAVLAAIGAALGVAVAFGATSAFQRFAPSLPRVHEIAVDARILLYMSAAAVVVTLLSGVLPALRATRGVGSLSRSSGRTHADTRHSMQWTLVGVQVALSVTLLAGAGLLVRSVDALSRVDAGFNADNVLTLRVSGAYGTEMTDQTVQRINRVLDEVAALPGVEATAIASVLPGVRAEDQREFVLTEGRADAEPSLLAENRIVTPGYFSALQIPLVNGELCSRPVDAGGEAGVTTEVMVNRSFVDRYFPGRSVLGLHLSGGLTRIVENRHLAPGTPPSRIVGIVGDAREVGADRAPAPTVYTCFSAPHPAPWNLIRTSGDPLAAVTMVRRKIAELEPQRSVYEIALLADVMGDAYSQNRLRTMLLTVFAGTALALACLGVYGTLSYIVSLRRREVSLRVALGAMSGNIVAQFLSRALRVVGAACAVGVVLAFAFTQTLSGMLYGVSPMDPITFAGVVALVLGVAATAAFLPAWRASRIDPTEALREE